MQNHTFLVAEATLASDNLLVFRKNLLERTYKLIMPIEDKIRDVKLRYNINKEAAKKIRIDKYEYLTGEEILPSNGRQIIEQSKFTYSYLKKLWKN